MSYYPVLKYPHISFLNNLGKNVPLGVIFLFTDGFGQIRAQNDRENVFQKEFGS